MREGEGEREREEGEGGVNTRQERKTSLEGKIYLRSSLDSSEATISSPSQHSRT